MSDHDVPVPTRGIGDQLVDAFESAIGAAAEAFLAAANAESISKTDPAPLAKMLPSRIAVDGPERALYECLLLAGEHGNRTRAASRGHSLRLVLRIAREAGRSVRVNSVRWSLYASQCGSATTLSALGTEEDKQRFAWAVYQANDLLHLSYETSLKLALDVLGGSPTGMPFEALVSVTLVASEQKVYAEQRDRLVIRHSSGDDLIAYIKIMSSGNKWSRRALERFLDKACTAPERGVQLLFIDPYPRGTWDPHGIHGAIWNEIDPAAPFQFPDDRKLTLVSYCAARPPQAYFEPLVVRMTLPETALFLDPQWYVTVPLESTYGAAWETIPARWRRVLSE